MIRRFSMTTRTRARAAMRDMAAGAEGPRLRSRWRRIGAGRIAHVCLRTVEFAAALFIVGGLVLASRAGARTDSAGRPARPDRSFAEGAGRRQLRAHPRPDLYHAQFLGSGSRLQGPHPARRRWSNGSLGPERQGWPRPVRAGAARREGPPARARRARPAPACRRRWRALACGRERCRRDSDSSPGRDSRGRGGGRPRRFRPLRRRSHGRRRPGA